MKKSFNCRSCGHIDIKPILSLGNIPLVNSLIPEAEINQEERQFPLELVFCQNCSLVQITETVAPQVLFNEYLYFSSYSDTMLEHSKDLVNQLVKQKGLSKESFVIEIASNDGYLLQYFKPFDIQILGIEPAKNIARVAEKKGIPTLCAFFNSQTALKLKESPADVIIGINVLAHVSNLNDFVEGIKILLKGNGIGIFEFPYVKDMIDKNEFDTIYHEHLCYYSLLSVANLFKNHDLIVVDIERIPIHGGSLRVTVMLKGNEDKISKRVKTFLKREMDLGINSINFYQNFANNVKKIGNDLKKFLKNVKSQGSTIAGYGAAAKGAVLLNYLGIGTEMIDFVVDRNPHKQGLYIPGVHIPIYAPEVLTKKQPSFVLILAWNFAEEIITQQNTYKERGGKFIIPIPKLEVI